MTRIVIVGNGMVSHRLCDKLIEHRAAQRTADHAVFERSEMGGGDRAGSAGGAGGKAPRGIERSEIGGGDPAGSAGETEGNAPRGIDDARHQLIAGRIAGLTQLAEIGAHLLETMLQGEAVDSLPIKELGELAAIARPPTDPDKPT